MKYYAISEEHRAEVLRLIRARSYFAARNLLMQLEEFTPIEMKGGDEKVAEEEKKEEEQKQTEEKKEE